jgi:hypothetical protein
MDVWKIKELTVPYCVYVGNKAVNPHPSACVGNAGVMGEPAARFQRA